MQWEAVESGKSPYTSIMLLCTHLFVDFLVGDLKGLPAFRGRAVQSQDDVLCGHSWAGGLSMQQATVVASAVACNTAYDTYLQDCNA
jgi:hypothetical protein